MESIDFNLVGKLLIAMPEMGDHRFDHSVVYICSHSQDGAMGLIINKPQPKLRFVKLLKQLEIKVEGIIREEKVHYGGPVETVRGFVLHTDDYQSQDPAVGGIALTATLDILQDIARGEGPKSSILALGYAGWAAGQLEAEIAGNGWLTCDADQAIVFEVENTQKWTRALAKLGVSPLLLSSTAGRA
tara:strand:- start:583 stop:1143 length:561 start_codon:yes stop_codon:yes gene_type:complete